MNDGTANSARLEQKQHELTVTSTTSGGQLSLDDEASRATNDVSAIGVTFAGGTQPVLPSLKAPQMEAKHKPSSDYPPILASMTFVGSDEIHLVDFPFACVDALRTVIRDYWTKGIQSERRFTIPDLSPSFSNEGKTSSEERQKGLTQLQPGGDVSYYHVIKFQGTPWRCFIPMRYWMETKRVVMALLAQLATLGWELSVSHGNPDGDSIGKYKVVSLFFTMRLRERFPSCSVSSMDSFAITLDAGDRLRILFSCTLPLSEGRRQQLDEGEKQNSSRKWWPRRKKNWSLPTNLQQTDGEINLLDEELTDERIREEEQTRTFVVETVRQVLETYYKPGIQKETPLSLNKGDICEGGVGADGFEFKLVGWPWRGGSGKKEAQFSLIVINNVLRRLAQNLSASHSPAVPGEKRFVFRLCGTFTVTALELPAFYFQKVQI